MDYSPRYDSVTTLTRELPEDWRPTGGIGVFAPAVGESNMLVDQAGSAIECQPAAGTYATVAALLVAIQNELNAFGALPLPNAAITISIVGGLVNLSSTVNFNVSWSTLTIRHALGFTGDLIGSDDYTATNSPTLPIMLPTVTVTTYDISGTALDTGAADVPGWYLTTATVNRGSRTLSAIACGMTTADWEQGRRALLYSNTGASAELVTVEAASLTGSVWTLSFRERFGFPHASGIFVIPWWITYDLDATDETVFTLGNKGTVVWTPTAVWDYPDLVDTWFTREMLRDLGATEAKFKAIFPRVHGAIRDAQDFAAYVADAQEGLRQWLAGHGQDIDALTDRRPLERLLLREVAWTVASQAGEDLAGEFERLEKVRAEARQDYAAVLHAQDVDQNHIITEEENSAANQPMPMRVW